MRPTSYTTYQQNRDIMRLHTNKLRASDIRDMLQAEQAAGRIAEHVSFKVLREHNSSISITGIEIQLQAEKRDAGRRAGNSGSYGAMVPAVDGFAATYDEWGWLFAAIYRVDEMALFGSPKYPAYKHRLDFNEKTGYTYDYETLLPALQEGHWPTFVGHPDYEGGDPYPYVSGRQLKGRKGAGRVSAEVGRAQASRGWPVKLAPRNPVEYAEFAHLQLQSA